MICPNCEKELFWEDTDILDKWHTEWHDKIELRHSCKQIFYGSISNFSRIVRPQWEFYWDYILNQNDAPSISSIAPRVK